MMIIPIARYRFMHVILTPTQLKSLDSMIRDAVRKSLRYGSLQDAAIQGENNSDLSIGIPSIMDEQYARYTHTFLKVINGETRASNQIKELIKLRATNTRTISENQFAIQNLNNDQNNQNLTPIPQIHWIVLSTFNTGTRMYKAATNSTIDECFEYEINNQHHLETIEEFTTRMSHKQEPIQMNNISLSMNTLYSHVICRSSDLNHHKIQNMADKSKSVKCETEVKTWTRDGMTTICGWVHRRFSQR
jgi:hypothetical protein